MSQVLNTVDGVEITQEMVDLFAKRFDMDAASNEAGILGSIGGWITGRGTLDSHLTDSEEGRRMFAPVRAAYFKTLGFAEPAHSHVKFEVVAKPE